MRDEIPVTCEIGISLPGVEGKKNFFLKINQNVRRCFVTCDTNLQHVDRNEVSKVFRSIFFLIFYSMIYRKEKTPYKETIKRFYVIYERNESQSCRRVYAKRERCHKPNIRKKGT